MDRANAWLARVNAWLLVGISSLVVGLLLWRRGSFPSSTTREAVTGRCQDMSSGEGSTSADPRLVVQVLERPSGNGADKKLPAQTEARLCWKFPARGTHVSFYVNSDQGRYSRLLQRADSQVDK